MTSEHPSSLLKAYSVATGIELTLSESRKHLLSQVWATGVRAEDVTAVCKELNRLIKAGTKGYTESSLDFRNVFVPDTLEERVVRLRQRQKRLPKPVPDVTHEIPLGANVVRFLAPQEPDLNVPLAAVQEGFANLTRNIKG